ncbi:ABC transporter ATP-binding protein [Petrocella sp. FN5]|uniref:ABC transporter ATP-binding protein n=1 Tax=Petrocella sp. FN5 TaxID=3032002 RepID=UPI0023DC781A|nr:ABC transporter ATP-binding protein [Petrocella sp. FN5]MDF1617131.1 ABC transporter ATP-binding protein [Petrocella sp. FN5]
MENVLDVNNLVKEYKNFSLKELNFSLHKGEITGFIGQNGSGKTTTIKCILNLVKCEGEIKLFGKNSLDYEKESKDNIGVVFDELPFDDCLNAKEVSKILKYIYSNWSDAVFKEYLIKFGLSFNQILGKYSKGMKTKLSLAVALSHKAQLLILDEPTSGLDPVFRCEILDELKMFANEADNAVLFSTHITSDLEQIADNVLFIHKGEIVFCEKKEELHKKYLTIKNNKTILNELVQSDIIAYKSINSEVEVLIRYSEKYIKEYNANNPSIDDIMRIYSEKTVTK